MIITPNLLCGGTSKIISLLCQYLNKDIFDITLICINKKNAFYTIDENEVRVIDLNKKHVRNALPQLFYCIKKEKPEIVFSMGQHLNIFLAMLHKYFFNKINFIARETIILSFNNTQHKFAFFFNKMVKIFYPGFTKIICQSKEMANDMINFYKISPEKIEIINNPAARLSLNNNAPKALFKTNNLRLLSIGRLSPEKGYKRLLAVAKYLPTPFEYIILGDGIEKNNLEKLIKDFGLSEKVFLKGNVNNTGEYLNECDILLHGSWSEGFPNVIIEAGMYGKPAVAFNEPGVAEAIVDGFNGFLVPSDNINEFVSAIINASNMYANKSLIINYTIEKHSVENVIKNYERVFSDCARPVNYA